MKQDTVFIPFLLPGMNEIINWSKIKKGNWNKYASEKSKIEYQIGLFLAQIGRSYSRVWIDFVWCEKSKHRDPDNISVAKKFILDAMVKEKIIENDGWKQIAGWTDNFVIDKINPGVNVIIKEME